MGNRSVAILHRVIPCLALAALALLLASCPNPLQATLAQVVKDYSTPKTTSSVQNGNGIARTTPIVITFTETMDTGTATLGGTMASESDGGKWSSTAVAKDTLTISPVSKWTVGSGRSLIVNCKDLQGYVAQPIVITLGVLDGVVYARALDGDDNNPGAPDLPKKTITSAVALAAKLYAGSAAEVHVAEGQYNVSYEGRDTRGDGTRYIPSTEVTAHSIGEPEASSPRSRIRARPRPPRNTGPSIVAPTSSPPRYWTVSRLSAVGARARSRSVSTATRPTRRSRTTPSMAGPGYGGRSSDIKLLSACAEQHDLWRRRGVVNGHLHLQQLICDHAEHDFVGPGTNSAYGIINSQSTPRIVANTIGGTPGMPYYSTGIYNDNSSSVILRNSIDGGYAYTAAVGVDNDSGSIAKVFDNTIHAGTGPNGKTVVSMGVSNENSASAIIQCNTIDIGNPGMGLSSAYSNAIGIVINACSPVIDDNIIFCNNGLVTYQNQVGVWEQSNNSPAHFYNNDIYNCLSALYYHYPSTTWTSISSVNSGLAGAANNVSANPSFANIAWGSSVDWHLTPSSPTAVTQGGYTLTGTDLNTDTSGTTSRTVPWSIGAYEY